MGWAGPSRIDKRILITYSVKKENESQKYDLKGSCMHQMTRSPSSTVRACNSTLQGITREQCPTLSMVHRKSECYHHCSVLLL